MENSTTRLFHFPYQAPDTFVLIGLFLKLVFPMENNTLHKKNKTRWCTRTKPAASRSRPAMVTRETGAGTMQQIETLCGMAGCLYTG